MCQNFELKKKTVKFNLKDLVGILSTLHFTCQGR